MEKWSGQFNSIQYPPGVASGQIEVDLQTNENGFVQSPGYTTSFKVNYTGIFRSGQVLTGTADVQERSISASLASSEAHSSRVRGGSRHGQGNLFQFESL
uniref:Uncharacterized protein n=1 Tax=viral metagenome TaxID=1070528 RepID=A0A6C0IYP3_9ZZZZ